MQSFLIDFLPVLAFLIAFKLAGIYVATTVGIVMTALQVILTRFLRGKFDTQQLVTLFVFVIFGGLTLYFHNPLFVKWKPSVIFWVFSLAFFGSFFLGEKTITERLLSTWVGENPVPRLVWKKLNAYWSLFFLSLGCLNLYIAYHFSTDTWVNFKVYGLMSLFFLFSVFQAAFLSRYIADKSPTS
jgi:intracellular septation protein